VYSLYPSFISGALLGLSLHQLLMIDDQLFDFRLKALALLSQLHVLLSLPRYLLMASTHLFL